MFVRDKARPVKRWGIQFRSVLEVNVAEQLDALDVGWAYERAVPGVRYLPDFLITGRRSDWTTDEPADPAMDLPAYIEVKPPEALYAVRDAVGLGERFIGSHRYQMGWRDVAEMADELHKPKRLAEHLGCNVLVAHAINRSRTLAVVMHPDGITVTREHPLVNWRSVLAEREREAWRRRMRAEAAERERERQAKAAEYEAERQDRRVRLLRWFRAQPYRVAMYDGWCHVCGADMAAADLVIAKHDERWYRCCRSHL